MTRYISALFLVVCLLPGCAGDFCDPGTLGCDCLSSGECRLPEHACLDGICVEPMPICDADGVCTPAIPQCYTPCSNDLVADDGQVRTCSDDGLMKGCLSGSVCEHGSCVPIEATSRVIQPGTCFKETDCPDFQTCIEGRCYSNCEQDAECGLNFLCHRRVCRQICMENQPCSDHDQVCSNGVCLPVVRPGARPAPPMEGNFELTPGSIQFTSNVTQAEFTIVNQSANPLDFTVYKKEQRVVQADGTADIRLAEEGETPLIWLEMGSNTPLGVQELPITVPANGQATIKLANARNEDIPRWSGVIEIVNEELGMQTISLTYSESVRGRWAGSVHYFGNFNDGSRPEDGYFPLETWMSDKQNLSLLTDVPNAFLQAWGRFRNNAISIDTMGALVASTLSGSWQFPRVQELCQEAGYGPNARCALFGGSGSAAVIPYTSAVNINPIPSGIVEMNLAINLRDATANEVSDSLYCSGDPHCFVGRIDTASSLQYGGNPTIVVHFEEDPVACQTVGEAGCVAYLSSINAQILVGGRYLPEHDDLGCGAAEGLEPVEYPWLVPAFLAPGSISAGESEVLHECRDTRVPFASDSSLNVSYAGANPVPDGRSRRRQIELVDGIMVEQHMMMLIIREKLAPFHGGSQPLYAYGYAVLERQDADLEVEDYQGSLQTDERIPATGILNPGCDAGLVTTVTGDLLLSSIEQLSHEQLRDLSRAVVRGDTSAFGDSELDVSDAARESIHYLCIWREEAAGSEGNDSTEPQMVQREVFNGGPDGMVHCPPGSTIIYFAVDHLSHDSCRNAGYDPAQEECNFSSPEYCLETLVGLIDSGCALRLRENDQSTFSLAPYTTTFDLVYRCALDDVASCDDNRFDLREGKIFLAPNPLKVFFSPIESDIHQAFRYKTQFVSRSGKQIGFAPEICQGSSGLIPYCYDPTAIEKIANRVDCALSLHSHLIKQFEAGFFDIGNEDDVDTLDTLRLYLIKNFSALQHDNPTGDPILEFGFERLYSELLIMLGDDAYTASFASRFDLAGLNQLAFEGTKFEAGGIDLSGAVGFEMYKLYQATQYFEKVLDRFYKFSPLIWENLEGDPADLFITQAMVTTYLDRVIRASTQNANAWSQIARRYRALNRSDLARIVLERTYTRSYQESLILSQIMTEIARRVDPAAMPQVILEIERAQQRYRMSMLDMQMSYTEITDQINFFGLPPDYIPFPALNEDDVNGFEVIMDRAWQKLEAAKEQEEVALGSKREFDVDQAVFQSELVAIRQNYESQLGEICGTFQADDGRVYPAIARYGHLNSDLAHLDDPCGAAGNGELWLKAGDLQTSKLELQRVRQEISNSKAQIRNAFEWVGVQCDMIYEDALVFLESQNAIDNIQGTIDWMDFSIGVLDKIMDFISSFTERGGDVAGAGSPWEGSYRLAANVIWTGCSVVNFVATTALEAAMRTQEDRIRDLERKYETYTITRECDYLSAELIYTVREMHLEMELLKLDVLNAIWNIQVELSMLGGLDNERKRLEAEWSDTDQMTINVAAAQNDPNIRIYKNDAIINADRSFTRAIKEAYRATRIYEYYTATTYAGWEKLFLIRMVSAGDYNLAHYLAELEESFYEFEDYYGNPDTRVTLISMRDDVFKIPRYSIDGLNRVLTADERVAMFREKLSDPALLDDNGMLTVKFNTGFSKLSPMTTNHKILFIEIEMFGDTGDPEGRVYLNQVGTGVVEGTDGDRRYYAFPSRMAVMNPLFNGDRSLGQDSDGAITGPTRSIYRSYRFRERPFVQTNWELILNQRTEQVNEDINLGGLDDIVIYIFYTDFTR